MYENRVRAEKSAMRAIKSMNERSLTFQQVENMTFDKAEAFAIIEEIPSDDESVDKNEDDESEDERFDMDVVVEDEEAFT
ncbi:hypothetical protein FQA39_LY19294 [Lamprigera yunnana]|nr:hypothetical protein FQA39_LY19294 [Lamprigera yunnana]